MATDKPKLSKSEYQKAWRSAHPRDKEEVNNYMREYIANSESINCQICGGKYKTYSKYKHVQSQKHISAVEVQAKVEQAKAEAEAEAARKLEEAKPKPRKRKTPTPEPTPAPEPVKPTPAPRKKPEALKVLEEYGSSDEETHTEKAKLADLSVKLQGKIINASEVETFIDKHFAESADPNRASSSKTPRRNKNSSLWKKVANELDGRKWSYLGENLGAIVSRTYDKPSVQADFLQMLKMVILHFTKTPKAVEETMKQAIFHLKQAHVSKQK